MGCTDRKVMPIDSILGISSDYVAEFLDHTQGGQVSDLSIFRAHAAKYEVILLFGCRETMLVATMCPESQDAS